MDTWSSFRDKAELFYRTWKPEIQIYGIGFMLTICGILTRRDKAALIVFGLTIIYDLMRRYGEPYRQLGEQEILRRQKKQQQWWKEQTEDILHRFIGRRADQDRPKETVTRLIPAPTRQGEDPPESPSSPLPEIKTTTSSVRPPVTHET